MTAADFAMSRRFGVDLVSGEAVLHGESSAAMRLASTDPGVCQLLVAEPAAPVRRMRVAEYTLNPDVFPPEKTLFKCAGAWSPGDPSPVVPLSLKQPDDTEAWRYRRVFPDGTVRYRSELFALLASPDRRRALIAGFVTAFRQAARIHAEVSPGKPGVLRCVTYPHGAAASPEKPLQSELLFLKEGDSPEELLHEYLSLLRAHCGSRPNRPLTGWSDWQYYRRAKTEKDVVDNVLALKKGGYPVEYIMLDDGYQKAFGDWLEKNDKFEHDIRWLARFIRDNGFVPGIWIAPFTASLDSDLAKAHPDWLLKGADGNVLVNESHMGRVAPVDMTHPGALAWLENLTRTLVDYGYGWIKLDGPILRYIEKGAFREPGATPVSAIRRSLEVMRRAAGGDVVIEGEGYYGPSIGLVDTQRVTQDIQPEWPRLRNTARDNLGSLHFHGRLWVNNPDAFILRDTSSPHRGLPEAEHVLTRDELELEIAALALTGGVAMLTDKMDELKPERAALADAFLPPYPEAARPLPGELMKSPYPERFVLPIEKPWGKWWIGACFNWDDEPKGLEYPLPEGAGDAIVVDFWRSKMLSVEDGALKLKVRPHGVRLFSMRPVPKTPALVGLVRHITQGGVEVMKHEWDGKRLEIEIAASRAPMTAFVHAAGRRIVEMNLPEGATKAFTGDMLKILLPRGGPYTVRVEFDG